MKRKSKKYLDGIYRDFPLLFWKECMECKQEFVREKCYRKLMGPFFNGSGKWKYICSDCAKSIDEAADIFDRHCSSPPPTPPPSVG